MKKLSILMLILFITSVSFADVITKTYYFDAPEVEFDGEYAILQLEDSYHLGNPGEPSLPYIGINLLLPRMQAVSDITIEFYEETPLGNYTIYPKQQPMPLSLLNQAEFTPPDQAIYSSDSPFPTKQFNDYSTHYLAGYSVGSFAVTPLSYVPSTKELNYYKKAVVTLETSYDAAAENAQKFLHNNPEVEIRLAALVDNIDMIGTYTIPQTKADGYDYIIITNSIFENDFQVLADFHEMRGLRSKVTLVSDIMINYPGVDVGDQVRNYIIAEYTDYPVQYVLLGGDTDIIPDRGLYTDPGGGYDDDDIPGDLYYGCLDRTAAAGSGPDWNNNNNSLWGEHNEADLLAEVYIGRICSNNTTEIANQINKIQSYLESPVLGELETTLLVGEYLWPNTYGGQYMNELLVGSSSNGYTTVGIPGTWTVNTLYEMNGSWSANDLYNELNLGPNFLNHLGHGNTTHCLNIDNNNLTTYNLTNDGITHNFYNGYSQACYSGSIDNRNSSGSTGSDCFMEVITNMSTAASAFVGNSRYGWGQQGGTDGASQHFHRQYIDVFFETGIYSVSGANQLSKEQTLPFISTDEVIRWCYYEVNEFGDPALSLWTAEPSLLMPTYPQTIMAGVPQIDISAPAGSRVVVYDDDTIYGFAQINVLGSGTLFFDTVPNESGILHIAVVAHNYHKFVGDIVVTASVVTLTPGTINVNIPTQITVEVMAPDSVSPQVGVDVWAEGLDYISATEVTDAAGIAVLNVNYCYGPTLQIYGQNPGDEYFLFHEEVNVTALDLTNPSLDVTTDFGLIDTFALNLEGTIEADADEADITLWVNVDGAGFGAVDEITYSVTPSTLTPVDAIIAKSGYNIFEEIFPVIIAYGNVSGLVTESQNGSIVSNAEVCFYEHGANPNEDDPVFVSTTDVSGIYSSSQDYPVEYYDIYVTKWGYDPYQKFNYFLGYGSNAHDIVLDPVESGFISGNVFNDFMLIDNATLSYMRSDTGEEYASVQSTFGSYEISLPNFSYTLYVTAEGQVPYVGTLLVSGDAQYDYHLGFAQLFDDAEDGTTQWTSADWGVTEEDYVSPTHSFTDSPGGSYPSWTTAILELTDPVNLNGMKGSANLYFNAKWDIESNWDYAQVLASTDGITWTALEGEYTELAAGSYQPAGEPVYDGEQLSWIAETSDLSDFAGESQVYVRFLMDSDGYVEEDGIHVDDILIGDPTSSYEIPMFSNDDPYVISQFKLNQNFPNPVTSSTTISFSLPANAQKAELNIYNIKGQLVKTFVPETSPKGVAINFVWDGKDNHDKTVANGVYFYKLETSEKQITKKMVLMK
ncbi:MAG: C25 family cysteine peptidase [Candidatus Celaenobacter antarcticus]|nr:C25 family cysteine peptidase [Candidatus Celaenobacter antarcticus]